MAHPMPKLTTPQSLLEQAKGPPLSPWHESVPPYECKGKNIL